MPGYAAELQPQDRWAIVAYLRVLQYSQHAPLDELPEGVRKAALVELENQRGRQ